MVSSGRLCMLILVGRPIVQTDPGVQAGCADVYIQDCTNAAFERKTGSDFTYRNE